MENREELAYVENINHFCVNVPVIHRGDVDPAKITKHLGPAISHSTGEIFDLVRYSDNGHNRLTAVRVNLFARQD